MPSLPAFAAPLALLVPFFGPGLGPPLAGVGAEPAPLSGEGADPEGRAPISSRALPHAPLRAAAPLSAFDETRTARQVRIEQRVVIRISPQRPGARQQMLTNLPREEIETRFEERKMGKCVPLERIAGVQTGSGNRLLLFLTDKRMVTVDLEKTCHARDFYSGFYVERSEDGKFCVDRDRIKSRTGVKCEVERMRQLVAVEK